ncbi:MAG: L-aspartate oxidase [Candidatus Gastranaerophilales bacterium]|nr:L-aspartate oxidase [Candidatus Gastranaerophilales bacterium]
MKHLKYSVVIVGSGIAGIYAAIKMQKEVNLPDGLLIVTKSRLIESNSKYAQGGMVCVMPENKLDSCTLHIEDTLKAGAGLSDIEAAEFVSKNSARVVNELQKFGVDFDRDENNKLKFTKEAAHSVNRILHAGGDATGFCIENALVKYLSSLKDIDIYEETLAVELLTDSSNVNRGLIIFNNEKNEYEVIETPIVILATGGIGQLYSYTTNPDITTGDGIALAYRAGAVVKDMEFVQFHPTAFSLGNNGTMFLITEALRGEGAKLVDKNGKTFMEKYDSRLELAPRDIVTRAIFNEMSQTGANNVFLNAKNISEEKFEKRFPTIFATCKEYNINPSKDYIPVSPSAHYFMGGIKTKINGTTSIKGLYSIGEAGCTGLHGANRLASNSILECAVTAFELVELLKSSNIQNNFSEDEQLLKIIDIYQNESVVCKDGIDSKFIELKNLMWNNVGIIRNKQKLESAKQQIDCLKKHFGYQYKCPDKEHYEFRNMLIIASIIVDFALNREESRGAHYREDFPQTNINAKSQEFSKYSLMKEGIL